MAVWSKFVESPGSATRPPERRIATSLSNQWMGLVLEELDHGIVLLNGAGRVLHTNQVARAALEDNHPLEMVGNHLRARLLSDAVPLAEALEGAEASGRRCLLRIGDERAECGRANVVVVPLNRDVSQAAVLLILERRQLCGDLAAQWFALRYQLTPAETEVLKALSNGVKPTEVAQQQGVAISTVRSQIQSIRAKSGADSIGELMRQLALLPPLVSSLRPASLLNDGPRFEDRASIAAPRTTSKTLASEADRSAKLKESHRHGEPLRGHVGAASRGGEIALDRMQTAGQEAAKSDPSHPLSAAQLGQMLGGLSDETVRNRERAGELFSFLRPGRKRGREYPAFQAWNGISGDPLKSILEVLSPATATFAFGFFTSPTDLLAGLTPIEALIGRLTSDRQVDADARDLLAKSEAARQLAVIRTAEALVSEFA